jgi:hypothetical protein
MGAGYRSREHSAFPHRRLAGLCRETEARRGSGRMRRTAIRVGRTIGWGLIGLALAALGYEALAALQGGGWRMIAAGELWYALDRGSLNVAQAITQRYLHPALWDPIIQGLLTWPAWSLLGAPGVALVVALSGRSRDEHQEEARLGAA